MPAINRLPFGLLGFLGIKNSGTYPTALASTLAPTLELAPLYFGTNVRTERLNGNVTAIGFNQLGQVPNGEAWAVIASAFNSQAALGAGVTLKGAQCYALIDGTAYNVGPLTPYASMTTGEVFYTGGDWTGYKVLPPGALLGFYCTQIAAGPVACSWTCHYARLDT